MASNVRFPIIVGMSVDKFKEKLYPETWLSHFGGKISDSSKDPVRDQKVPYLTQQPSVRVFWPIRKLPVLGLV